MEQRFREERDHSIHTEIHNEKLAKACKLLVEESMSTNDVAQVCGYPSLQYMYAVFKNIMIKRRENSQRMLSRHSF